ncbi:MAG: hypothetical protein H6835_10505 [Planctomycetes bacterium]|nr:hypothetical protein [Planctomycetota bacterium]
MSEMRWGVVEALLDFVLVQEPCTRDEWPVLEGLLDRLAVAVPRGAGFPVCAGEMPKHDQQAWRQMICQRFPDFGFYSEVPPLDEQGDPITDLEVVHMGDAIDDLLDIALELDRASWCRRHGAPHDGERYLSWAFSTHWGAHLRGLQGYLHHLIY